MRAGKNFLAGLKRLHASSKLHLTGDWEFLQDKAAFDDWLKPLESITWVAYIEPPPYENCPPEQMAKYLARYLTGGPISDRRIVSRENGFVTFLARVGPMVGDRDFPVTTSKLAIRRTTPWRIYTNSMRSSCPGRISAGIEAERIAIYAAGD